MQAALTMDLPRRPAKVASESPIAVTVLARSPALRSQIEMLAQRAGAQIVAESTNYEILLLAIESAAALHESFSLINMSSPGGAHICLLWTGSPPAQELILRLTRAGVAGLVSLRIDSTRFQAALNAIRAGLQVVDSAFTRERALPKANSPEDLTEREQQVLAMMADGLANKEIASQLGISTHTVKFHISSILGKLGASSRTEAVSIGMRSGRVVI